MELLKELKLINHGLIEINSSLLIKRYNDALSLIGLAPTQLKTFFIDGWGWSPEIAKEKDDKFYLSHGLENPYAIILTPEQKNVSVYMPTHSFDKQILKKIFLEFEPQIHDLTMKTAIVVECDQEISRYVNAEDLLGIEYFMLNFKTVGDLSSKKKEQQQLESEFYKNPMAWSNHDLREQLVESYAIYGVLAKKKYYLPSLPFSNVQCFYTKAFGGTFVINSISKYLPQPLLIHEKKTKKAEKIRGQAAGHMEFNLQDPKLITYLKKRNVIGVYEEKLREEIDDINRLLHCEVVNAISDKEPELLIRELSTPQLDGYIHNYLEKKRLGKVFSNLECLCSDLKKNRSIDITELLPETRNHLLRPNPMLDDETRRVIWRILLKVNSFDVFRLYVYDKEEFFKEYLSWPLGKRHWVAHYIAERYQDNDEFEINTKNDT
ncbi:MAG: hypothetical protein MRY57_00225 [Candidatus Pacebacteria bacterium]|nr:hypothetical protein [Candidatus Paceibacterota bacterium]